MRANLVFAAALAAAALLPPQGSRLDAQSATFSAFVTTLGRDTVAVEQYSRIGNVLTGDYVTRPGGTVVNHYVLHFGVNNVPNRLELRQQRADGRPIPNGPKVVTMTVGAKETVIVIQRDTAITRRFAVNDPFPLLGTSLGMFEVAFLHLRTQRADSTSFSGLPLNAPTLPDPIQVRFHLPDSARVWTGEGPLHVKIDGAGHILGLDARATKSPIVAERVTKLDLQKLIAAFGAADAAGKGLPD